MFLNHSTRAQGGGTLDLKVHQELQKPGAQLCQMVEYYLALKSREW